MSVHHPHTAHGERPEPGILTTLGPSRHCRAQAKVLGWLLQRYYPDVPRAVVGHPDHIGELAAYGWDLVATTDPDLQRGFESKLSLWRYTPFERTLFLDVDILPMAPSMPLPVLLDDLLEADAPVRYYAKRIGLDGNYQGTLIRDLAPHGLDGLWATVGGGHYCWDRGPEAKAVFEHADRIAQERWSSIVRYRSTSGRHGVTPDEVVVAIALEHLYPVAAMPHRPVVIWAEHWWDNRDTAHFAHFQHDNWPHYYNQLAKAAGVPAALRLEVSATWGWQAAQRMWARHWTRDR